MNIHSQVLVPEPMTPPEGIIELHAAFHSFDERQSALSFLQQTLRLMADIQQHRGSSMAILAENLSFEPRLALLQSKIRQRLIYLSQWKSSRPSFIKSNWEAVLREWQAVSQGWREDTVLNNFELHCHLVEKLLTLIRAGGKWILETDQQFRDAAGNSLDLGIVEFTFNELPNKIEVLAKLRGLSTHVASVGHCDGEHRVRIEYLLQLAKREQTTFRSFAAQRPVKVLRLIPGLLDTQLSESVFSQWITKIYQDVLQKGKIRTKIAAELFTQGTQIINGYFAINEQSLVYTRLGVENILEEILNKALIETLY